MNNFLFSSEKNLSLFDTDNDYILFDISDELYAIKILDIKEIVSNRTIVEVEDLPEYIKGFANIRNIIFPIFELKQDLALENSKKYGKYSVIVIFEDPLEKLALIADSVLDIYNIPQENIKNSSGLDKLSRFIDFEVEMNNRTVKIINTKKIIKSKY